MRGALLLIAVLTSIPVPIAAQWFVEVPPRSSRRLLPIDRSCTTPPGPEQPGPERCDHELLESAMSHHREAQHLMRGRALAVEQLQAAMEAYRAAARLYREYLACDPPDDLSYTVHFNLADALFWSEQYAEAAPLYRRVRDWPSERHLEEFAAERTIEALERLLRPSLEDGSLELPAIDLQASPREPPPLVAKLLHAREVYFVRLTRTREHYETRQMMRENALLLARYGYFDHARARLELARAERCRLDARDPDLWGEAEWEELRAEATEIGAADLLRELADPAGRCA